MSLASLKDLLERGFRFWAEDDRLRYSGPSDTVAPDLSQQIARHEKTLIDLIGPGCALVAASPAQQRLLFSEQLSRGLPVYNVTDAAFRVRGSLDSDLLRRALSDIHRRHEALRASFIEIDGLWVQRIFKDVALDFRVVDLTDLAPENREDRSMTLATEELARTFDLMKGSLFRAVLYVLGPDDHLLVFPAHLAVFDGVSLGVLLHELGALYGSYQSGDPPALQDASSQFDERFVNERGLPTEEVHQREIAFWRECLAGELPSLELPADRVRPPAPSHRGGKHCITISRALTDRLRALAQAENTSLFSTMLAALDVLVFRYTGHEDLLIATLTSGRAGARGQSVMGFFQNTVALRNHVPGNLSLKEFLRRIHQTASDAFAHQETPFDAVVRAVHPTRDAAREPVVQVMLVQDEPPIGDLARAGLRFEPLVIDTGTAIFDLTFVVRDLGEVLQIIAEYSSDLFDAGRIIRMLGHFENLLAAIVEDATQRIDFVPILSAEERHKLLVEWNATEFACRDDVCLHDLFEAQVERDPGATAIIFEGVSLTYRELNARANQLAHYLLRLGVGPEVLAGICAERSIELMVSVYGVLKAGGAYVPLDPALPPDRLAFMLRDSGAKILITQERTVGQLPECEGKVIIIDAEWDRISLEPDTNPRVPMSPDNLAYVIYTSGSTGTPKGVTVPHRAICNHAQWHQQAFPLGPGDSVLQKSAFNFDTSMLEIVCPLVAGARLVIARPGAHYDPSYLVKVIIEHRVTTVDFLPAQLAVLLDEPGIEHCDSLRWVTTGADVVPPELVRRFHDRLNADLYNCYGPTETTVEVTYRRCERSMEDGPVPIGRPCPNTRVYIVDRHVQPVPIGVPGELMIGGAQVARGYLNRPELTTERFIADPFSNDPAARIYRTGDLARYRSDGNIEFLGRIDDQVKVRGFRIELGEVEAAVRQHPNVADVAVVAPEERPGVRRLIAYAVLKDGDATTAEDLRRFLQPRLPEYMLPGTFVLLDELPLLPSGKIDRRALTARHVAAVEPRGELTLPRTPIEERLASLWRELLGLDQVSVRDNFFEVGGHSLLAAQLTSRIRGVFGVDLPLRVFFEGPTIAALAECVASMRRSELPPITRIPRDEPIPLSLAQKRLWFIDQLIPGNTAYTVSIPIRMAGDLDARALEHALTEIVRRHEPLRTRFVPRDGEPVQEILPASPFSLKRCDLSAIDPRHEEIELHKRMMDERHQPFDLSSGPLIRAILFSMGGDRHVLLILLHHIISDGWSVGVLVDELAALYRACDSDLPSPIEELSIQYADFAVWQRGWLRGQVLDDHVAYWKERLAGLATLEFPADRTRPARQSLRGATEWVTIPSELTRALHQLSVKHGVTLFMTLLAAFKTLLYRYCGQEDIVVGSPIANRNYPGLERLIGFFVNTLVMRTDLGGDPAFLEVLDRVRETALGAYEHQDAPFDKLVEELHPERDPSRNPIFQIGFALQNVPLNEIDLPGLSLQFMREESHTTHVDLEMLITEEPQGLVCMTAYSTDLFDAPTIRRFLAHWLRLVEEVAANPKRAISEIPFLSEEELHRLIVEWNATGAPYPREACLHQLIERQAEETPDAPALMFDDATMTYRELDARANQMAHYLRELGVGPDRLAGVCLERSLDLVVALYGVLKAGGAYVPLDPSYPRERLMLIIEDAAAPVVLTRQCFAEMLSGSAARLVFVDADREAIERAPSTRPASGVDADRLAYVIHTSGSTGRPKGVMVSHRAICNHMFWMRDLYPCTPEDRVLQWVSFNFDASLLDLFAPLTMGACVVLARPEGGSDPRYLIEAIERYRITGLNFVPSPLQAFLAEPDFSRCTSLRWINCGGEALSTALAARFADALGAQVRNMYGPTEAAVTVLTHVYDGREGSAWIPIGRPPPNVNVYVLDRRLQPAPIGVAGELCITGVQLARGYLNQPELTDAKFVRNPFSDDPGSRLYRTGDLVRYRPDGEIEFVGRVDDQVKVRGFRIELGEIETALREHPKVRDAVVSALGGELDRKKLVAFLDAPERPHGSELRAFLQQRLPAYMVPSAFVCLDAFPLTPNGKVDRRALEKLQITSEEEFVAPRNTVEERLAAIWRELLGVERIGAHDDFFALGGHSLLATQMMSRVRTAFNMELPLRLAFEAPTLEGLAERIASGRHTKTPAIRHVERDGVRTFQVSFAQQRLWIIDQLVPGNVAYSIPVALRLRGKLDVAAVERSLTEILRRHEALRTRFVIENGEPRQEIMPPAPCFMRLVELSEIDPRRQEAELQRDIVDDTMRPFDLATGPLFRSALFTLGAEHHVLLLLVHHIVSDGWSFGILLEELAALYTAYRSGRESPLPELPVQYVDFAAWQREWLQGEALEVQLLYWRDRLSDAPLLDFPTDHPRPPEQSLRGAKRTVILPTALTEKLKQLSLDHGATLFMTLLAAFKALLQRYCGQDDIMIGSPIANRNHPGLEGTIGFFVNTLALRTDLSGNPTFLELLERVRATALGAYEHQDVPFDKLVEELRPQRDPSRNPIVQIGFGLQNAPFKGIVIPGLAAGFVEDEVRTTHFDLELLVTEDPDGLVCAAAYSTDLFEDDTIRRFLIHWGRLIESVVANPSQRLSEISLLSPEERRTLLVEWNATSTDFPRFATLAALFEGQVARALDAEAVVFGSEHVTYDELNARVNRLAHYLRGLGVDPGAFVGLCLPRNVDMIVATLAVIKAGAAYVPLDADYPKARIAYLLRDANVPVVITQSSLSDLLPRRETGGGGPCPAGTIAEGPSSARLLCLDEERDEISRCSSENLPAAGSAADLAYVMYTSGSTGEPKGVSIPRRAIARLVLNTDYLQLGPGDRVVQAANMAFDAATFEIWGPLLTGGCVVIMPRDVSLNARDMAAFLRTERVTAMFLTTALFNQVAQQTPDAFTTLRCVMFGGEQVDPQWVRTVLREGPPQRLLHVYGPTETTTFATWHWVKEVPEDAKTIPIGRPIANTTLYVLDRALQPVPVGVPGELYIGGDGLARDYLHAPEMTAARFVSAPFAEARGERLYKTGDSVRYLADGSIEFLGRIDFQVKMRGFRIELGEIETTLRAHPAVQDALVVVLDEPRVGKRLAAYLAAPAKPDAAELRAYLQERLPVYMIPRAFVYLDAFPLNPNGKVDRRALPKPDLAADQAARHVSPRTETERGLAAIWENLLKVERVGIDDNFFNLGGHSLLAMTLIHRIETGFGKRLPLAALFRAPTIRQLAELIANEEPVMQDALLVPLQREGEYPPFFCVPGIRGEVFSLKAFAELLGRDQPFYAIELPDQDHIPKSLGEYAEEFVEHVRSIRPHGPYYLGGLCFGGVIAYEMAQQLTARGEEVAFLGLFEAYAFDGRPLWKTKLAWMAHNLARGRVYAAVRAGFIELRQVRQLSFEKLFLALAPAGMFERRRLKYEGRADRRRRGRIFVNYTPRPYAGKVFLFRAIQADDDFYQFGESANGWAPLCSQPVEMYAYNCGHGNFMEEPHIDGLARDVRGCFERLHRGGASV